VASSSSPSIRHLVHSVSGFPYSVSTKICIWIQHIDTLGIRGRSYVDCIHRFTVCRLLPLSHFPQKRFSHDLQCFKKKDIHATWRVGHSLDIATADTKKAKNGWYCTRHILITACVGNLLSIQFAMDHGQIYKQEFLFHFTNSSNIEQKTFTINIAYYLPNYQIT
jgi:hypothetical protein